jgi:hypothetical protein
MQQGFTLAILSIMRTGRAPITEREHSESAGQRHTQQATTYLGPMNGREAAGKFPSTKLSFYNLIVPTSRPLRVHSFESSGCALQVVV